MLPTETSTVYCAMLNNTDFRVEKLYAQCYSM